MEHQDSQGHLCHSLASITAAAGLCRPRRKRQVLSSPSSALSFIPPALLQCCIVVSLVCAASPVTFALNHTATTTHLFVGAAVSRFSACPIARKRCNRVTGQTDALLLANLPARDGNLYQTGTPDPRGWGVRCEQNNKKIQGAGEPQSSVPVSLNCTYRRSCPRYSVHWFDGDAP